MPSQTEIETAASEFTTLADWAIAHGRQALAAELRKMARLLLQLLN